MTTPDVQDWLCEVDKQQIKKEVIEDEIKFLDSLRDMDEIQKELWIHNRIMKLKQLK